MARLCSSFLRNCPKCSERFPKNTTVSACPACSADLHCHNDAVPGYSRCSVHGGPAPSRNFYGVGRAPVTGERSKFQLTQIAAKYNEIQRNGQILSNRNAMEIIWKRVEQLAERIDLNQAPERMAKIQRLWKEFRDLDEHGRHVEAQVKALEIDAEFEAAYHDYMAWQQMFDALALHSKMTESEVKIMKDMRMIMTAEDAYELVAKVMAVLLGVLKDDPKKLKEAQYELSRLVGAEVDRRAGAGHRESRSVFGPGDVDRERVFDTGDQE